MSPILVAVTSGALVGAGVWVLVVLRFARPSLADRLADPPRSERPAVPGRPDGWVTRLGRWGAPLLAALGLPAARTRAHLDVCDRDPASYLAEKTAVLLLALVAPPALGSMLALASVTVTAPIALAAWLLFAVVVWLAPDLSLRSQAEQRREQMRHAIGAYTDLVVVALAGGAGVNAALSDAAAASPTWAMRRIRAAIRTAGIHRQELWVALRALGRRYDVPACEELAASLQLAGADGARVRSSLSAKAASLRTQHLAQIDAHAQSATERMSLPVVLLFAGFLLLIGYPALATILSTL